MSTEESGAPLAVIQVPAEWNNEAWQALRQQLKEHFGSGHAVVRSQPVEVVRVKPIITFATCDDWIGCYLDGELIDQGHSFYAPHLLRTLSDRLGFHVSDTLFYTEEQMDAMGSSFPERLEEIDA